jgi:hypothetical protein
MPLLARACARTLFILIVSRVRGGVRADAVVDFAREGDFSVHAHHLYHGGAVALSSARDAEGCRVRAHGTLIESSSITSAMDACAVVARSADARCRVASASARCRVELAGARARSTACVEIDGDGACERCVLRTLGGRAKEDDEQEDSTMAFVLERSVEFALYLDELSSVDRECKHHVALWRAESAARALEGLTDKISRMHDDAEARAEAITGALWMLDARVDASAKSVRALDGDVRALERTTSDAREITVNFAHDFDSFATAVFRALTRVERATASAVAAARFAADAAHTCSTFVYTLYDAFTAIETAIARVVLVAMAIAVRRFRMFVTSALVMDWFLARVGLKSSTRLRCGLIFAACARTMVRTTARTMANAAIARSKRRGVAKEPLATPARRSVRIRNQQSRRLEKTK